ncbi:MAG TPA: carboxyltransferase domain-containing protein, partial [Acidimicrobiia bacterium]|nr:carboxyltransferase domain-containing protein [Acidimicrobiia bacterium]
MTTTAESARGTRYSWGGDDHVFVELDEEMSLQKNFQVMAITRKLREEQLAGVFDICPANASYQVRYDPDVIEPQALLDRLRRVEDEVGDASDLALST